MMKRILPVLLLLILACAAGCKPEVANSNVNVNANTNSRQTANANANTNANQTIAPTLRTKEDKSVALVVYTDDAGNNHILVSPESIKLSKSKGQKLRFHVSNNMDVDIKEIVITFRSENPMEGDFKIDDVKAGDDKNSPTHKIKGDAATKSYIYGIKVYGYTSADPIVVMASPQLEIST